jgi:hypothetical protein
LTIAMTIEATRQQARIVIEIAQLRGTTGWYVQRSRQPPEPGEGCADFWMLAY